MTKESDIITIHSYAIIRKESGVKEMAYTIVLDAGHGGANPGATYEGRNEKDDVLALTLAVGEILSNSGYNVVYTRTEDIFESPFSKAQKANQAGADLFLSIHRNSSPVPETYEGVETLVYSDYGVAANLARKINYELEALGFRNIGVSERPNLIVLNSTNMPSVLAEVGFINSAYDNNLFDTRFDDIARGIADAIVLTLQDL